MLAADGKGLVTRVGGRRTPRPRRKTLAVPLLSITLLCCLFAPAASAGAASPDASAQGLLTRLALRQAELTAADGAAGDWFGSSVALAGDTALVGAPGRDAGGKKEAGAAYVFVRSGGAWTLQQKLSAGDGAAGDWFGSSVALAGDTALVGSLYHATAGKADAGAAYVFTRSGDAWTQQQKLGAGDGAAADWFGSSVALAGDTALVGAPGRDAAGRFWAGAAYVFTRSAGAWTQQAELAADALAEYDWFGSSVALSRDTALVGARFHATAGRDDAGTAYVFVHSDGTWTQQQELSAGDGAEGDSFGSSVALAGDAALVGAPYHATAGKVDVGAAYVITRSSGAWTQQQELGAGDGTAQDEFGASVALSGDTALVGALYHASAGQADAGAAYVFIRSAGVWTQRQTLSADEDGDAQDEFGSSVALAGDTALVGAPFHATAGRDDAGAAYVFLLGPAPQPRPKIARLSPTSGTRGALVAIRGSGFGAARRTSSVKFGSKTSTKYGSWSDTQIKCRVPAQAKYGVVKVTVTTSAGRSNAMSFTVKR